MDEAALVKDLHEIERQLGGNNVGAEAMRAELTRWREREPDTEFELGVPSQAAQHVLLAWTRRLGLKLYRRPRQRKTTICVRVPRGFMHEVLWPQIETMGRVLEEATSAAVLRIVEEWSGEAAEGPKPSLQRQLFG